MDANFNIENASFDHGLFTRAIKIIRHTAMEEKITTF